MFSKDLQISNEELCEYSNQKISAILTALARNGNIKKRLSIKQHILALVQIMTT